MAARPQPIEIFLNEQRADLAAFRLIVQIFLVRLLAIMPQGGDRALGEMEDHATEILRQTIAPPDGSDRQDYERMNQMVRIRLELFFQDLRVAAGYAPKGGAANVS